MKTNNPPLPLGTMVHPWGMISLVTNRGGERCYMFTDPDGCRHVSLMPASPVEEVYARQQRALSAEASQK